VGNGGPPVSDSSQGPGWWRRFRSLPPRVQVASWIGLVVLVIVGSIVGGENGTGNTTTAVTTQAPSPSPSVTTTTGPPPTPTASPPAQTAPGSPPSTTALAGLATLPVKGRAAKTGYSRAQFGQAWTDDVTVADGHNGCDTRNDILRRDLTNLVLKAGTNGCVVASGVLHDPYTKTVIVFTRGSTSGVVQIDHVVALANAWQTGAQQLSLSVRTNLANDPLNLLAVSGAANQQKGDADAASWLPPNKAFRCSYVAIQVAVKIRYHLWVTPAEHAAIARVLSTCPSQPMPSGGPPAITGPTTPAPPAAPQPGSPTPTSPAPTPTITPSAAPTVRPGAFCSPPGARGVTSAGTPMICKLDSTGQRYRWGRA